MVGWGRDIKGEPAESLQEIDMPFVPYHQCLSTVPRDFRGYLTSDKFCAGRLNGECIYMYVCVYTNNCESHLLILLRNFHKINAYNHGGD